MKAKEFKNLKVGDKVVISTTKYGPYWNEEGEMDKWLGKTMTIRRIKDDGYLKMEEDDGECLGCGWDWGLHMIAKKVNEEKTVKEVKRHAKKGEWVKIVKPALAGGHYKEGDILEVVEEYSRSLFGDTCVRCKVLDQPDPYMVLDSEYVVLENYKPEENPTKGESAWVKTNPYVAIPKVVDLNLKFDKARINMGDEWIDVDLKKWTDYEDGDQLQLTLEDGTVMVVHSMNCILYKGTLPGGNE